MTSAVPFASGRDADVYALDGQRVLRRYRRGGDVSAEVAMMTYVGGLGFPVPTVYSASGPDIVMERIDGPSMVTALVGGDLAGPGAAGILADLHRRLHDLPPRPGGTGAVVHLDLHPDNVVMGPRGPVLIDWRNAADGPPDLDIAMTAVILGEVAVDNTPLAAPAESMLALFLDRAGGDPVSYLDEALARRRADPALAADEVGRVAAAGTLVARLATGGEPRGGGRQHRPYGHRQP